MEALLKAVETFIRDIAKKVLVENENEQRMAIERVLENYDLDDKIKSALSDNEAFRMRTEDVIENYDFRDIVKDIANREDYVTSDELKDTIREVITDDLTFEVQVR